MIKKIKELGWFFIKPNNKISSSHNVINKVKDIFVFYFIEFLLMFFIIFFLIEFVGEWEDVGINKLKQELSFPHFFLIGIILAPIFEEAVFRLSLVFKPINLAVSSFVITFFAIKVICFENYSGLDIHLLISLVFATLMGYIIYRLATKYSIALEKFWNKNFRWIYYFSFISFALMHTENYEMIEGNTIRTYFLTFPQMISGVFLGYIRIKYGFVYAIIFHAISNILPVFS